MTISLSIVVAVHNLEKYVSACLDSALSAMKDVHDYEIILLDDSSCDDSPKIMKEYSIKYSQIQYFRVEYKNIGRVRQYALSQCQGKYFTILDGDDTVYGDFLKNILPFLRIKDFDLLATPIEGDCIKNYTIPKYVRKKDFINMYLKGKKIQGHFAGKFYRTSLLKKIGIVEKKYYEDEYTLLKALPLIKDVFFSKSSFYSYFKREDSLTNSLNTKQITERMNLEKIKIQTLKRQGPIAYCSAINELRKLSPEYLHEESIKILIDMCKEISMTRFILSPFVRVSDKKKYLKLKASKLL
ncbi:glycosyltransferase family 2 protein [Candidatus Sodalis sp. SoCistrobi]|uniref:glycosyltransferase family 2 protein n=1 Tax=Candidatus Sodalis sp. SoCistrobi TaxID=1922216 RepID=UPI001575771A|nr:glycosyltransferase family 2 protein [Candidatus Sodalis sp. SoCistrobi]